MLVKRKYIQFGRKLINRQVNKNSQKSLSFYRRFKKAFLITVNSHLNMLMISFSQNTFLDHSYQLKKLKKWRMQNCLFSNQVWSNCKIAMEFILTWRYESSWKISWTILFFFGEANVLKIWLQKAMPIWYRMLHVAHYTIRIFI